MLRLTKSMAVAVLLSGMIVPMGLTDQVRREPTSARELEVRAREFVAMLADGKFGEAVLRFDETMTSVMPETRLKAIWAQVNARAGTFVEPTRATRMTHQGYDIVVLTCRFQEASLDVKVVFDAADRIAGLFFAPAAPAEPHAGAPAPTYANRAAYVESEVVVGQGAWAVPGTLAVPRDRTPCPGVVLVHGSGPHDRDETIGPNKPFRDLAWGLATKRIAVLRYDKRTYTHASKLLDGSPGLTVQDETIDDALAAVRLLRSRPEIREDAVFVLGHSLGGMLVPRIAEQDRRLRGFVVMAAPAGTLVELLPRQVEYLAKLDGAVTPPEQLRIEATRQEVERIRGLSADDAGRGETSILGAPPVYWLDIRDYRASVAARSTDRPLLVLHGERDYQVPREEASLWRASLESRADVRFRLYPKLNHLFMPGDGPGTPEEYSVRGVVAEVVIEDIAAWVHETSPGSAARPAILE